ncbi:MAG: PaaI family thioesterase [Sphingomonas oligoaromativorans]
MKDYKIPAGEARERTVAWPDPSKAAALTAGLSGLEIMRGIRDGRLPGPSMAYLIGFRCVKAEPGEIEMRLDYGQSLENTMGMLHGGAAATMLDTTMGCAAHTMLPTGAGIITLDLTITYLRPVTARTGAITASGRVINAGRRTIYVGGEVHADDGSLMAHAVGNFSVVGERSRTEGAAGT